MNIYQLPKITKKKKRLARGNAGHGGTTAGRGTKGQRSRTSRGNIPSGFEGGQTALKARLPKKRGFFPYLRKKYQVVNIDQISAKFKDGDKIDKKELFKVHLIKNPKSLVKVLGDGQINKNIEISADAFSKSAKMKIEKNGGKVILK
jgi:large subunit ribosomal protein L15